jgi:hypothetical protein
MKKNSKKSTKPASSDVVISDEMRDLIIRYMEACNNKDHASELEYLRAIKQLGNKEFGIDPS